MTLAMSDLLAEGKLTFEPRAGTIDVEKVAAAIEGIGFGYRDEAAPSVFALFPTAELRDACRAARRADAAAAFPFVPLITVSPEAVVLFTEGGEPELRDLSAAFITWMMGAYDCHITNEFDSDMATLPTPLGDPPEDDAAKPAPAGA